MAGTLRYRWTGRYAPVGSHRLARPIANADEPVLDDELPGAVRGDRRGQQLMLDGEDARGERCLVVAVTNRNRALRDDRSDVDLGRHVVDGAAVHANAVGERASMRVEAGVCRQQRRMDVDQAPFVAADECRVEHAHEARQHDEVGLAGIDGGGERAGRTASRDAKPR